MVVVIVPAEAEGTAHVQAIEENSVILKPKERVPGIPSPNHLWERDRIDTTCFKDHAVFQCLFKEHNIKFHNPVKILDPTHSDNSLVGSMMFIIHQVITEEYFKASRAIT